MQWVRLDGTPAPSLEEVIDVGVVLSAFEEFHRGSIRLLVRWTFGIRICWWKGRCITKWWRGMWFYRATKIGKLFWVTQYDLVWDGVWRLGYIRIRDVWMGIQFAFRTRESPGKRDTDHLSHTPTLFKSEEVMYNSHSCNIYYPKRWRNKHYAEVIMRGGQFAQSVDDHLGILECIIQSYQPQSKEEDRTTKAWR